MPNFLLLTISNSFNTFCGTCAPGHFNVNSFQVADDVDLIRGKHQICFRAQLRPGAEQHRFRLQRERNLHLQRQNTTLPVADFMIGRPQRLSGRPTPTPDDLRQSIVSVYVQDTFRISSRFTLNFGLRWEPNFPTTDKYGRGTSFSEPAFMAGQFSKVYPNAPAGMFFKGDAGIPRAMWNGHWANFAPRVGLVCNPSGKGTDTLRIGGALLYENNETWFDERKTTNPPIGTSIDIPNPAGGFSNPYQGYPGGSPFPDQWPGAVSRRGRIRKLSHQPEADLCNRSGMLPISGSCPATGSFPRVTWETRPRIFGVAMARSIPRPTFRELPLPVTPTSGGVFIC